jgi:hypothetical protein
MTLAHPYPFNEEEEKNMLDFLLSSQMTMTMRKENQRTQQLSRFLFFFLFDEKTFAIFLLLLSITLRFLSIFFFSKNLSLFQMNNGKISGRKRNRAKRRQLVTTFSRWFFFRYIHAVLLSSVNLIRRRKKNIEDLLLLQLKKNLQIHSFIYSSIQSASFPFFLLLAGIFQNKKNGKEKNRFFLTNTYVYIYNPNPVTKFLHYFFSTDGSGLVFLADDRQEKKKRK